MSLLTTSSHHVGARRLPWSLGLASSLLLGGCGTLHTGTPGALPPQTPLQALVAHPAHEAAVLARSQVAPAATPQSPAGAAHATAPAAAASAPAEPRFDLIVSNAAARDVYLALAADGRYNMLTHPELTGSISVTLRRVTMREALEALRDVYGYDFRIEGRRITIYPATMQSRVFVVNYLHSQRSGRSDVRVSSGSAPGNSSSGTTGNSAGGAAQPDSSQISTQSRNDLWAELGEALRGMIGTANGRSVILSPQSGMIAVRAMPEELRQVESLLNAARMAIERQVMLDVKIVQVDLREGYQSGIDWSVLRGRGAVGSLGGLTGNPLLSNPNGLPTLSSGTAALSDALGLPVGGNGLFGLSLAANSFQMVLGFLETHGDVQTLSSPRLATLNNQKAVLKVGTDDYFVTNISGGTVNNSTTTSNNGGTTLPSLTLTPFFSGIALDVTPQIDDGNMITLHVHPSVSAVTERNKQVDLGTLGSYKLPLASSSINETDTIVRIPDGQIVAIGGLMQMESTRTSSGLPGSGENAVAGTLMGNRLNSARKKELVVLIKPTIIRSAEDWQDQTRSALAQLQGQEEPARTIRLEGRAPLPTLPMGAPTNTGALQLDVDVAAPPAEPAVTPARKGRKPKTAGTSASR